MGWCPISRVHSPGTQQDPSVSSVANVVKFTGAHTPAKHAVLQIHTCIRARTHVLYAWLRIYLAIYASMHAIYVHATWLPVATAAAASVPVLFNVLHWCGSVACTQPASYVYTCMYIHMLQVVHICHMHMHRVLGLYICQHMICWPRGAYTCIITLKYIRAVAGAIATINCAQFMVACTGKLPP